MATVFDWQESSHVLSLSLSFPLRHYNLYNVPLRTYCIPLSSENVTYKIQAFLFENSWKTY
jgi:hypothetical protein